VADAEESYAGRACQTPESRTRVVDLYDADVRATDAAVFDFLAALRREAGLDAAILVVLSDHGEDLWDRPSSRAPGHGHALYEELIHVPLVVRAPGRVASGVRLSTPVSLIDVAPTLLDLCGLAPDLTYRGRSLAGALRAGREPEPSAQLSENVDDGPERFAVREGDLKVILADLAIVHKGVQVAALPLEVYDLGRDPGESDPTSGRHAPDLGRALELLRARRRKAVGASQAAGGAPLPEDVREQLRSLGYIQ
jgi:arylsulfatase A-like enzyme